MTGLTHESAAIVAAISKAIHDHNLEAVPPLVRLLAVHYPETAQDVLDLIGLGADLSAKIREDQP